MGTRVLEGSHLERRHHSSWHSTTADRQGCLDERPCLGVSMSEGVCMRARRTYEGHKLASRAAS